MPSTQLSKATNAKFATTTTKKATKKQVMKKPAALRMYNKTGNFGKSWMKTFKDLSNKHLLTALLQLVQSTPITVLQVERMNFIQNKLNECNPNTVDANQVVVIGDLVANWGDAIAGGSVSLDKLLRAVLVHTGSIFPKSRSTLVTREPVSRGWSRAKKDAVTHVAKVPKPTRVAAEPYPLTYNVGKWKPPKGQGQYPGYVHSDDANGGQTLRHNKTMRQLRQLMEKFADSAVAWALMKIVQECTDCGCTEDDLMRSWWWGRTSLWRPSVQHMEQGNYLLDKLKKLVASSEITSVMVVRTSIAMLRDVRKRSNKCSKCSKELDDDEHPTKLGGAEMCPHRFCKDCLIRQRLCGACSLCEAKHQKLSEAFRRHCRTDLQAKLRTYQTLLRDYTDLLHYSATHPHCPDPKISYRIRQVPVTQTGASLLQVPQGSAQDDEEWDGIDWVSIEQDDELHTRAEVVRVEDDTDVVYHNRQLSTLVRVTEEKLNMEVAIRSVLIEHPYLKLSLQCRSLQKLPVDQFQHVPQDLVPDPKCKCRGHTCKCKQDQDVDLLAEEQDHDFNLLAEAMKQDLDMDVHMVNEGIVQSGNWQDRKLINDMRAHVDQLKKEVEGYLRKLKDAI